MGGSCVFNRWLMDSMVNSRLIMEKVKDSIVMNDLVLHDILGQIQRPRNLKQQTHPKQTHERIANMAILVLVYNWKRGVSLGTRAHKKVKKSSGPGCTRTCGHREKLTKEMY